MSRASSPKTFSDEAVESPSAAVIVANAVREGILHGTLQGGERLRQDAIATRFSVSQTIVREAFKQLVSEGFLRSEPRRGVCVAILTADEAWELTQLWSLIEAQSLEWAIPQLAEADLESAGRILCELDKAKSTDRIIALNFRFHEALYAPARRERTLAMIATLRLNFERYLRFTWEETPHLEQSQREHWRILELCAKRDVASACSLLKSHILAAGDVVVRRLRARPPRPPSELP